MIRGFVSVAILLAVSSAALAQPAMSNQPAGGPPSPFPGMSMQGTPEDQKACSPDAVKFCKEMIPDTFRVLSCLQANRQKISPACQGTLAKYGQ